MVLGGLNGLFVGGVKAFAADTLQVWQEVGNTGFSEGRVDYTSLYVYNGTPYVAYMDGENSDKATVKKYDNVRSDWVMVGSAGFSEGRADYLSLYIAVDGTPYVAYMDGENSDKATVKKYDSVSSDWVTVGKDGLSESSVAYTSLFPLCGLYGWGE
ncbi:hypothetical protein [Paenibacillus sp. NRS-1760]|uniref:hypothetical protein n=1 Tax=Paenibacillus sp. NRS-1760 TaxID=3233902 RepID=UPI003D269366